MILSKWKEDFLMIGNTIMNTAKYESPRVLKSVLRQVPMMNLESVREIAKEVAHEVGAITGNKIKTRVIFRGMRWVHNMCTLKHEAHSFDIYVKTVLPNSISPARRREISEYNRAEIKSLLTDIIDVDSLNS